MRPSRLFHYLLPSVLAATVAPAAAVTYVIIDLGDVPGGMDYSRARAISDNHQVVGEAHPGELSKGFVWDQVNGMQLLAEIPDSGAVFASGINDHGIIAGTDFLITPNQREAVWWPSPGAIFTLPNLGGHTNWANGINNGNVIVGTTFLPDSFISQAVYWDGEGVRHSLGWLPDGGSSSGSAINETNQITGYAETQAGIGVAFRWEEDTGMTVLELTLGAVSASGYAINDSGTVAGYYRMDGHNRAALWRDDALLIDLGGAFDDSYIFGMNNAEILVGATSTDWNTSTALIWDEANGMRDLNTLIDPESGWYLRGAYDINNHGWIVGDGDINGAHHAFVAIPRSIPEPAVAGFISLAALLAARCRRPLPSASATCHERPHFVV